MFQTAPEGAIAKKSGGQRVAEIYSKFGIFFILIVLVVMSSLLDSSFLASTNIINVLRNMAVISLVAYGMTYILILGMIDLSSGSVMAFAGCVCCLIIREVGSDMLGIVCGILTGCAVGALNGFIISFTRIPAFIMTLGMQNMMRGFALIITGGLPVSDFGDTFRYWGQGFIGNGKIVPVPIVIMIVGFVICWVVLNRTKFGRHLFAVGGNENAARASGINTKLTIIKAYLLNGFLVGCAGVLLMSRLNSGQPSGGENYEFNAITAAVIGGTSLMGGVGSMGGTLIGAAIIGILDNIMNLTGVDSFWQRVVRGGIIVVAVIIDLRTKAALEKK